MSLADLKKATVYVKVEGVAGMNTGSGFLVRVEKGKGLIATNHHVIRAALAGKETGGREGKVTVVFDSGDPKNEAEYPAEVLASDPAADLAVLRVTAPEYPKPIDPRCAPVPTETLAVRICGFPLGERLSTGRRSPSITIANGAVSSIRRDDGGNVAVIQIDGSLIPGNSGGPIVDPDGRLVGVAVAYHKDAAQIGFAIPAAELIALLDGRILSPVFLPVESKARKDEVEFRALVPILDPLKQIKSVAIHVWTGDGEPPRAGKDPATGWKLLPGTRKFDVPPAVRGLAMAEVRLPLGKDGRPVVVQTVITTADGTVVSAPVRYDLKVGSVQTASDAIPLSIFARNPEQYAGQVVAVRATLSGMPPKARWNYPELVVYDETDEEVSGVAFLTDPELAGQIQEARPPGADLPVRLTVRVGKPGPDGVTPVRVVRTDIIGRGDRLLMTIPPTDPANDPLVALNRNPEKFDGQTVQLEGQAFGQVFGTAQRPQLSVRSQSGMPVTNAQFTLSPKLADRFRSAKLNPADWHRVRMTGTVEVVPSGTGLQAVVTLTKLEVLGPDGQTLKKIE
jgi:S1-C subfamily serine protease